MDWGRLPARIPPDGEFKKYLSACLASDKWYFGGGYSLQFEAVSLMEREMIPEVLHGEKSKFPVQRTRICAIMVSILAVWEFGMGSVEWTGSINSGRKPSQQSADREISLQGNSNALYSKKSIDKGFSPVWSRGRHPGRCKCNYIFHDGWKDWRRIDLRSCIPRYRCICSRVRCDRCSYF